MSGTKANPKAGPSSSSFAGRPAPRPPPAPVGHTAAAASFSSAASARRPPLDVDIARQDALSACNPDIDRPFASLEDACNRLLPFHVLADYDDDDVNDKYVDTTGRVLSKSQLWNEGLAGRIQEFTATFQKQIDVFNALSKKRESGEMRTEEGLMIEQLQFQAEKQKVLAFKAEMDRRRALRDAEARRKAIEMARAEQVRMQEAARLQQVARIAPGVSTINNSFGFGGGVQWQEERKSGHDPNSSEQDGAVDDMLNEWVGDANESSNVLAQNRSEEGTFDLNASTSNR